VGGNTRGSATKDSTIGLKGLFQRDKNHAKGVDINNNKPLVSNANLNVTLIANKSLGLRYTLNKTF